MLDRDRVSAVGSDSDSLATLPTNGRDHRLNSRQIAAIHHNFDAIAGKMKASGSANAARAACDHADFAGKIGIDRIALHDFKLLEAARKDCCYLIKHTIYLIIIQEDFYLSPRTYRMDTREAAAAQTRERILSAARDLLVS